jgi:hypothetical protein
MATTFDVNRIGGGTFELVQDPSTGQYSYKKVGFNPVKSLTIPDLGTATTAAATTTETKKDTADISKPFEQLAKQTSGRDDTIDYTGQMLKDARKIDPQLQMTRDNLTSSFIGEERPTKTYSEQLADLQRPPMLGDTGGSMDQMSGAMTNQYRSESEKFKTRFDPTQIQPATPKVNPKSITVDSDNNLYKGGVLIGKGNPKSLRVGADGKVYRDGVYIGDGNPKSIRAVTGAEITGASGTDKAAMTSDTAQLGISEVESTQPTIGSFGTDPTAANRFRGVSQMGALAGEGEKEDVKPEPTALKKVSTGLKSLSKSVGRVVSSGPVAQIARAIGKPVGESAGAVAFNKTYFNVRGGSTDGQRIAGNPATDLYAGMNRTSKFGNLEKAGDKRISTREATIAKKGYTKDGKGADFIAKTEKMKADASKYKAAKQKATQGPAGGATTGGGGNGGGGGGSSRVICTDLHRTKELSTRDWVRDTKFTFKKLSIKHVKGYLLWAEPTVRHIQKYPRYRKIWKHIAQHRANDIAWRLNEGKFDLLGRIYAGIGEPLCWMLGNFVSDKQINRYNLSHWRRI